MLYLVMSETVSRAQFLDDISDINAGMISESVLGLRRYADWYASKNSLRTNEFHEASLSAMNGKRRLTGGISCPTNTEYIPSVLNSCTSFTTTAADYRLV